MWSSWFHLHTVVQAGQTNIIWEKQKDIEKVDVPGRGGGIVLTYQSSLIFTSHHQFFFFFTYERCVCYKDLFWYGSMPDK